MNPRARRKMGTTTIGAACLIGVGSTGGCSTVLGIGDWTNLTDGGPSAPVGDGSQHGQGSTTDATVEAPDGSQPGAEDGHGSATDPSTDATVEAPDGSGPNDGGLDATDGGGGFCSYGTTRCSSYTEKETCGSNGQWGSAVACRGDTSVCSNGSCALPPSCRAGGAGLFTCGASSENCCTSLEVPGGTYHRTYTNSDAGPTGESDPATVSGFRMDKYLVTVGRFRQFVAGWNAGWRPPAGSGKHAHLNGGSGLNATGGGYEPGWVTSDNGNIDFTNLACFPDYQTWTDAPASRETLPINCPNWYESYAFCIWDGGFLPSEAEWEYVAAGGSQERAYPWGPTAPGTACPGPGCQYAIYNCDYPSGSGSCTGVTNIASVGYAASGAGLWGQLDLEGELLQRVLDSYGTYTACADCANFTAPSERVSRGSYFSDPASSDLLPPRRGHASADAHAYGIGLRCARTP